MSFPSLQIKRKIFLTEQQPAEQDQSKLLSEETINQYIGTINSYILFQTQNNILDIQQLLNEIYQSIQNFQSKQVIKLVKCYELFADQLKLQTLQILLIHLKWMEMMFFNSPIEDAPDIVKDYQFDQYYKLYNILGDEIIDFQCRFDQNQITHDELEAIIIKIQIILKIIKCTDKIKQQVMNKKEIYLSIFNILQQCLYVIQNQQEYQEDQMFLALLFNVLRFLIQTPKNTNKQQLFSNISLLQIFTAINQSIYQNCNLLQIILSIQITTLLCETIKFELSIQETIQQNLLSQYMDISWNNIKQYVELLKEKQLQSYYQQLQKSQILPILKNIDILKEDIFYCSNWQKILIQNNICKYLELLRNYYPRIQDPQIPYQQQFLQYGKYLLFGSNQICLDYINFLISIFTSSIFYNQSYDTAEYDALFDWFLQLLIQKFPSMDQKTLERCFMLVEQNTTLSNLAQQSEEYWNQLCQIEDEENQCLINEHERNIQEGVYQALEGQFTEYGNNIYQQNSGNDSSLFDDQFY